MAVSRGFHRRRVPADAGRVPPGQYVTEDYPVLSAGPTPHPPLADWTFTIRGEVSEPVSWTWDQLRALPSESVTADIHRVTKWTKLDTTWTVYVCGPTSFVETATSALVALGTTAPASAPSGSAGRAGRDRALLQLRRAADRAGRAAWLRVP